MRPLLPGPVPWIEAFEQVDSGGGRRTGVKYLKNLCLLHAYKLLERGSAETPETREPVHDTMQIDLSY